MKMEETHTHDEITAIYQKGARGKNDNRNNIEPQTGATHDENWANKMKKEFRITLGILYVNVRLRHRRIDHEHNK